MGPHILGGTPSTVHSPLPTLPNSEKHLRLAGEVDSVVFQDEEGGFAVIRLQNGETVAGEIAPVAPGEELVLHGAWMEHRKFGRQFRAEWVEKTAPTTLSGMEKYLGSGYFPGIGPALAKRLVTAFGSRTLDVLSQGAGGLKKVSGIGPKKAEALAQAFTRQVGKHRVMAELRGLGLGASQARTLYESWGSGSVERARKDPYTLIQELRGFGFASAEKLAGALGIPKDSRARGQGILLHTLSQAAQEGHSCLPKATLSERLEELGVGAENGEAALLNLEQTGRWVTEEIEGEAWCWLAPFHKAEKGLAENILRLTAMPLNAEISAHDLDSTLAESGLQKDSGQKKAIRMALSQPISILTGGPGTGKTTLLKCVLDLLDRSGRGPALLASPTGRAAKRLQESTGRKASTLHRLLGFDPHAMTFRRGPNDPLKADFLVVDEASMLDLSLAHSLFAAIPSGCGVLLVGDSDQLPSVGAGTVLRDLAASARVPVSRLTTIHRQAEDSGIVAAAYAVLSGNPPVDSSQGGSGDFFLSKATDPNEAAERIERIVCERIPNKYGIDPRKEVLVLSPMYRGPLGVDALNLRLGAKLNPSGVAAPWSGSLRSGDRVMAVRNDYEREVFNGDTGRILAMEKDHLLVDFGAEPQVYRPDQLGDLVLAWCVTVHRAQGSEARAVVVVLTKAHFLMLKRNLLYTAITRGKELVVLVTDSWALRQAVGDDSVKDRHCHLGRRLDLAP